jgi:hypothetical protein
MNLNSAFENIDAAIEELFNGGDSRRKNKAKRHKQDMDKLFGIKKPKVF